MSYEDLLYDRKKMNPETDEEVILPFPKHEFDYTKVISPLPQAEFSESAPPTYGTLSLHEFVEMNEAV